MLAWPNVYRPLLPTELQVPALRLRDSVSKELHEIPTTKDFTMYVCGITPYDATHIGHAATYITFDLIHRFLLAQGVTVRFLENVTDIDDPLFERATRDGVSWEELGCNQIQLFVSDMTNLRVLPPMELTTVTEAMTEIIDFVAALASKGLCYQVEDDTYLDASQVTDFDDLPYSFDQSIELFRERGGDPDRSGKRHPLDPLLWRRSDIGEPAWDSSLGKGRPGWHVECNAISSLLIRRSTEETISLQGGGNDLKFPHHYMTALQGRARYGSPFADLFVHTGMIRFQGEKMSKSLGNLVFVSDLIANDVHPMAIRLALFSGNYDQDRDWSESLLEEARRVLEDLMSVLSRERVLPYDEVMRTILVALSDNLNTPLVLKILKEYIDSVKEKSDDAKKMTDKPGALSRFLDTVLGLAV